MRTMSGKMPPAPSHTRPAKRRSRGYGRVYDPAADLAGQTGNESQEKKEAVIACSACRDSALALSLRILIKCLNQNYSGWIKWNLYNTQSTGVRVKFLKAAWLLYMGR